MKAKAPTNTFTVFASLALLSAAPFAHAEVIFSESFEAPAVSGFGSNTAPPNWVGATNGFGASNRGLYNETVAWPATPVFTTPFGGQAYLLNYTNSGLTTAEGAIPETLTQDETYTVSFNVAAQVGSASGGYRVEFVAFDPADDNDARKNAQSNRPGTVLGTATGTVTTTDMSEGDSITFTPAAGDPSLGKEIGIRLVRSGGVLHDNIRLIRGHDLAPEPADGVTVASGDVPLSWSNMSPNVGTDTYVDIWFGTDPATDFNKVVTAGINTASTTVSAPVAATYYWRVDSYLEGNAAGTPVEGNVFVFYVTDTDGDGFPDSYELANTDPTSGTALNPGDDLENGGAGDGLTNLQEYQFGTDPTDPDSDDDNLDDGPEIAGAGLRPPTSPLDPDSDDDGLQDDVETNTGSWTSAADTGTNPADADYDNDGLKDGVETNTNTFVDRNNAGTDPFVADSDADGALDWYEAAASFTSPVDPLEKPSVPYPLPDPDGSTGVTDQPVKVYIMAGQSNTVGIGYVNGSEPGSLTTIAKSENKFPNLVDAANEWTERNDVWYEGVVTATAKKWLTVGCGADGTRIGPELGFGHIMGWHHDEPVIIIKASQGNRSLGWDFLPPGSSQYDFGGNTYAGYQDTSLKWPTGSVPEPVNWYAGKQYDDCFTEAHAVLDNFATKFPQYAAQGYEIAGFAWWQGHKDQYDAGHYERYEQNMSNLINTLRTEFDAPAAPFVVASIGFDGGGYDPSTPYGKIFAAQMAIGDPDEHPEFAGTVTSVDTTPYWRELDEAPGGQGFHYNNSAETYMLVGDAIGRAMLELLNPVDDINPPSPDPMTFSVEPTAVDATTVGMAATPASDPSGPVEYYFENTTNGDNSGWGTSASWINAGLGAGSYGYRVKARDAQENETGWSVTVNGSPGDDVTKPSPDPMSFATPPTAEGESAVTMSATVATDINDVEYYFDCTTAGGNDSDWQDSLSYTDTGLSPGTEYTYQVSARDKSTGQNTTAPSAAASATTDTPPPMGLLFSEDFESPDVAASSGGALNNGTLPDNGNWVGATQGFGASRRGITDKAGGDFAAPDPNMQAFAFRYTNSGLTTAAGAIGELAAGATYTVSVDVVQDAGRNDGTSYNVQLVAFAAGAARNDCRSTPSGSTVLATASGNAPGDGSWDTIQFEFTPEAGDPNLDKDIGIRFLGATTSATVDNVRVSSSGGGGGNDFADWIAGFSVGGQTGFGDDPDGDGIENGLEHIFGTDPSEWDVSGVGAVAAESNTVTFTHPQNTTPADDVIGPIYTWSKDMVTSYEDGASDGVTAVGFTSSTDTPTSGTTTVIASITGTIPEKLFMQVGATQSE